ncbi:hypothetical protein KY366_05940, partial [Candidatus Woesearchaeota archaeon]|nr:hypothetical protein [Candidatus Woesearchaeota archaeon]
ITIYGTRDVVGNNKTVTTWFVVDTTRPAINLNYPADNFNTSSSSINFNWTATDNLDIGLKCNLTIDGVVNVSGIESENGSYTNYTILGFEEGTHTWNVTCIDNASNVNTSLTGTFTRDITSPAISLDLANDTWQKEMTVNFSFTATDDRGIDTCILYGDFDGAWEANESLTNVVSGTKAWFLLNMTNRSYSWNIWCNDTVGNAAFNATNYTIYVDSIKPSVSLNAPIDYFNTTASTINFNWTAEDNLDMSLTCNLTIDGVVNVSGIESANGSDTNYTVAGFYEGTHRWNVTCIDNASNVNSSLTRTFTRDITGPAVNLESPANNTIEKASNWIVFRYNTSDTVRADNCSLILNNRINMTNKTITKETSQNFTVILPNKDYNWSINCTDALGNTGASLVFNFTVSVDTTNPAISLNRPVNGYNTSSRNISFNFTATDPSGMMNATIWANFSGSWLVNESNKTSLSSGQPAIISITGIEDGSYIWNVYACDDAVTPNCGFAGSNHTLTVDIMGPSVTLDSPRDNYTNDDSHYVSITFNGSITDNHYLMNVSLYHNATGAWHLNQTADVRAISSYFTFNLTDIANVSFIWNIGSCDLVGNCNFSSQNRTVILNWTAAKQDTAPPNISLISPANSSTWTSSSTVVFSYNVTDESNVTNCSLVIGNSTDQTDSNITRNLTQTFSKSLSNSDYNWSISCSDYYGKMGNSSTYRLTVSYSEPSTTPTGSGGGGSSGGETGMDITEEPEPAKKAASKTIHECYEDSECGLKKYCFEHKCHNAECLEDNECKEDESCWNYRCIKWFDMEILEFESPVKIDEYFDFTYFLKGVAEINGDVEIKFWIEQDGKVVTSGQDTIYMSSYEEKTITKKLFLPKGISSGTYIFYIEVKHGSYTAKAHRTIGIDLEGDSARITPSPKTEFSDTPLIDGLIGMAIFALLLMYHFKAKKIRKRSKRRRRGMQKFLHGRFGLFRSKKEIKKAERLKKAERIRKAKEKEMEKEMELEKAREAKRILRDVPPEKSFWTNDGFVMTNINDLLDGLNKMDEDTFKCHVNNNRNDFYDWINKAIFDTKLADDLREVKVRKIYIKRIKKRIRTLRRQAGE